MARPRLLTARVLILPLVLVAVALAGAAVPDGTWDGVPWGGAAGTASGTLRHEAYVWQRQWKPEVAVAVRGVGEAASGMAGVVVLAAEVELAGGRPRVVRVEPDRAALASLASRGRRVGVALRVGAAPFLFAERPELVADLAGLAASLVADARAAGVEPAELQVDHDCPTARLADCALVTAAVREAVAPLPTVFTALPSWLENPAGFRALAGSADGFVLQVHGLTPVPDGGPPVLLDPRVARRAVEEAARFGRPFRVALPTFAHLVAVDAEGRVRDVVSEDGRFAPPAAGPPAGDVGARGAPTPLPTAPAVTAARAVTAGAAPPASPASADRGGGIRWHLVRPEPETVAALVREWTARRPAKLEGVLWYRLPVVGDRLNWSAETLAAVAAGREPRRGLAIAARGPEPGLVEVDLVNRGGVGEPPPRRIALAWGGGRLLAADGLGGYRFDAATGELVRLAGAPPLPQPPGERRTVAWLRFEDPRTRAEEVTGAIDH